MKKIVVWATAFGLLHHTVVFAQKRTYTLQKVWQKTLQQYPSLTSKKQLIEEQELKKELIKQQFLPEINIQAQQSYGSVQNVPGSFFPLPGIYTISGSNKPILEKTAGSNLYASAVLQWNFMQFGREQKKLDVADAAIRLSTNALKQEEWQMLSAVTRIYFAALSSKAALEIVAADTKRLAELFSLIQSQASAGLRPGADTLLLKSALLQSIAKEHEQQAILKTQLIQLSSFIGENIPFSDLDTSVYYRFQQTVIGTGEALQNHPYLQVLNERIRFAEAEKEAIKAERYPSVGLLAGVGLKGSGIQTDGSVNKGIAAPWNNASGNYLVGVGLTWGFSSLYQNKTKRAIAERVIASAKADRDAVKIQLNAQYASALAGWDEQRQKLAAANASFNASKEAYELYEVRYQSGLISLIELLQLQKNLQDAESNYVAAVYGYWNELIQQSEALGNLSLLLTAIQP
ncbi:Outer membrane protein TolC [Hydrobacter penzbergensis]|uniref:Outer membrane protein TolC n=1 Tax=Hydrobacter penzbergensis TaxID=1235997 RepID=A0A8X8ICB7_9BACT|nr:TolC family protein [Hydrobacter penzbergensis]MBN8717987.1 TolC family protein [Sediminibacterium magnilacihabitans]PQV61581.1 outer membrane protein TolC [Sediminibacterium magnilacihabitans]SDW15485.1 Outer membrane protein TolC [Hydrobacter penzbergensis]